MSNKYINHLNNEQKELYKQKIQDYKNNPDKNIEKALNEKNYNLLCSIIKLDLIDPKVNFDRLMVKTLYLAEQAPSMFIPFEISKLHTDIDIDKKNWNDEYFLTHRGYLTLNFSLERMIHLIYVKKFLEEKSSDKNNVITVDQIQHRSTTLEKNINCSFNKFLNDSKKWIIENKTKSIVIAVVLAIIVWCLL